jgi:hypothetical protein
MKYVAASISYFTWLAAEPQLYESAISPRVAAMMTAAAAAAKTVAAAAAMGTDGEGWRRGGGGSCDGAEDSDSGDAKEVRIGKCKYGQMMAGWHS